MQNAYTHRMSQDKDARRSGSISIPVRMPMELDQLITDTAAEVKLSKQDTIRLSVERGLAILKQQLAPQAA